MKKNENLKKNEEIGSKLNELIENIKCPCCDNYFINSYRPNLLKCGHNVCSQCLILNKSNYVCLICLRRYTIEELNNCPINFLIDEIIHKLSSNNIISINKVNANLNEEIFYCINCNTLMKNKLLHERLFIFHSIVEYKKYHNIQNENLQIRKNKIKTDSDNFNSINYKNNSKLNILVDEFSETIIENIKMNLTSNKSGYNLERMKNMDLITENEFEKIRRINYNFNLDSEQDCESIIEADLIVTNKIPEIHIKINDILSNIENIKSEKFAEDIAHEVSNYYKNILYTDIKKNCITQLCHSEYNDKENSLSIYIYDSLIDNLFNLDFSLELLNKYEDTNKNKIINYPCVCSNGLDEIYLIISNNFYILKTDDNNNILLDLIIKKPNPRFKRDYSYITLYDDLKLYLFGGDRDNKKIEYFDFVSEMWIRLPDLPSKINHMRVFIVDSVIIIFDNLVKCFYLIDSNQEWKEIKLLYDGSFDLELNNYCILLESKSELKIDKEIKVNYLFKIVGGYYKIKKEITNNKNKVTSKDKNKNKNKNEFNENIYLFDFINGTIKKETITNTDIHTLTNTECNLNIKMTFQNSVSLNKSESSINKCVLLGKEENNQIKILFI